MPVPDDNPPKSTSRQELRGIWVSYLELETALQGVTDPAAAQQALEQMLDTCAAEGFNTVFFHVRAQGKAFYPSAVHPAAEAVSPLLSMGFDPLECAVQAAHERHLELHAWVNPYRLGAEIPVAPPEAVFHLGERYYYNPASDVARQRVLSEVRELLTGYAVDGIHFDDYFYPDGLDAAGEPFEAIPDGQDAGDWRRTQVDGLISGVYGLVHQYGRVFGVSPDARVERCRETAYADVAKWMTQPGYVDYILPQLYYGFENTAMPYEKTLSLWTAMPRSESVKLYIGLALYKAGLAEDAYAGEGRREWSQHEDVLARQVTVLREAEGVDGFALFRFAQLTADTAAAEWRNLKPLLG